MTKKYRKIWHATHFAKCEGFSCDECFEPIPVGGKYGRTVVEYVTERGNKSLEVMREHYSPGCGENYF